MLLGREVQHPLVRGLVEHQLPDIKGAAAAQVAVLREHLRVAQLKVVGDALTHHPGSVHSIDQHLRRTLHQVVNHISNHDVHHSPAHTTPQALFGEWMPVNCGG